MASYLREEWLDDVKMNGLMSVIKERPVNKVDYDRKMRFWTETIFDSCVGERNAVFDFLTLKKRFRRKDRIPASLNVVLDELKRRGEVITVGEWKDKHSGWVGWGLAKTRSWMFGSSSDSEQLLHLPTVKKMGQELLNIYDEELRSEVDCTGEVISFDDMFERAKRLISTTETFNIVLEHLSDIGELTVGTTKHGEKVLKFKDNGSEDPVKFTETDASLVDIRKAMTKLDREIEQLEQKVKKYDEQCRSALRSGEKGRAQNFLRQRKRAEKDVADKDAQYQKLLTMLHQISAAKNNKDVLKAYQSGTAAFKATLARQGLSPDKIHETMDDVANSMDEYKEIEEAISSPFIDANRTTDADLERELDELLSESKKDESMHLPEAPTNRFGLFDKDVTPDTDADQLEQRLARLRQAV
uniref:CHMP7 winged helix domain-containing protein n=1 Tax=Caenorhabditis japonica TaxID=281687 RepID=A0A8R1HYQ2_CAEJA